MQLQATRKSGRGPLVILEATDLGKTNTELKSAIRVGRESVHRVRNSG
jgi:2-methylaconitate cis-trans-isomerase PrpF